MANAALVGAVGGAGTGGGGGLEFVAGPAFSGWFRRAKVLLERGIWPRSPGTGCGRGCTYVRDCSEQLLERTVPCTFGLSADCTARRSMCLAVSLSGTVTV
ncbi:hypothetical protein GCM10020219_028910 [Nonomuraea dietziae]